MEAWRGPLSQRNLKSWHLWWEYCQWVCWRFSSSIWLFIFLSLLFQTHHCTGKNSVKDLLLRNLIYFVWQLCKWYFKISRGTLKQLSAERVVSSSLAFLSYISPRQRTIFFLGCFKDRQYRSGFKEKRPHEIYWKDQQNSLGNFSDFFDSCDIVVYEDRVCVQQFESAGSKAWKPNSVDWRWPEN